MEKRIILAIDRDDVPFARFAKIANWLNQRIEKRKKKQGLTNYQSKPKPYENMQKA